MWRNMTSRQNSAALTKLYLFWECPNPWGRILVRLDHTSYVKKTMRGKILSATAADAHMHEFVPCAEAPTGTWSRRERRESRCCRGLGARRVTLSERVPTPPQPAVVRRP